MAEFKIGGPGPGRPSGAYVNSEHVPHLLAYGGAVEDERNGRSGKYTVAVCNFVVCLTCKRAWADIDVGGAALAPRILSAVAAGTEIVAVRLTEEEAKPNQNPLILPVDLLPDEVEEVQVVFNKYGAKMQSGRIIFDVDAFNSDNAPPPVTPA